MKTNYKSVKSSLNKALEALGNGQGLPVRDRMAVLRDRRLIMRAIRETEQHARHVR